MNKNSVIIYILDIFEIAVFRIDFYTFATTKNRGECNVKPQVKFP
jgi:hypothetical protein